MCVCVCVYIYIYIDGVVIVVYACLILVTYCMVCHWANVCAKVMCIYYTDIVYAWMYILYIFMPIHMLVMCAVIFDDLYPSLLRLVTLLSPFSQYVY